MLTDAFSWRPTEWLCKGVVHFDNGETKEVCITGVVFVRTHTHIH